MCGQLLVEHAREEEEDLLPRFAATEGVTQDTLVRTPAQRMIKWPEKRTVGAHGAILWN
jgi:hypothetical protein